MARSSAQQTGEKRERLLEGGGQQICEPAKSSKEVLLLREDSEKGVRFEQQQNVPAQQHQVHQLGL